MNELQLTFAISINLNGGFLAMKIKTVMWERETQRQRDQRFMGIIYYIGLNDRYSLSNLLFSSIEHPNKFIILTNFFKENHFSPIERPNKACSHKYFLI